MARKSRKPSEIVAIEEKSTVYHAALYARLSIEDNGIDGDSIENQIFIIKKYIEQMQDLELSDQFVDNGLTGTNFDRPGFTAMMDAVRKGKINCIVVKDLSRFGRNYLETGNFLEKIFPYLGVRFISVTDHFDSFRAGKADTLLIPLKSILHDTYAKDISKKVTTAIDIKKKRGRFMGKIPPYGYVRDNEDRYKLVVHSERAKVVRDIFSWRMAGDGPVTIAHRLNDLEIPTQFQIRFKEGFSDGKPNAFWHGSAVTDILKNPCYIGCIVERKSSNALYKGKNHTVIPRSEWKLIENTHEPIIDKDIFYQIQDLLEEGRAKKQKLLEKHSYRERTENILSGMVRCGICGAGIHRDGGYFKEDGTLIHYRFGCSNKYLKTDGCTSKAVYEQDLLACIFEACKKQLELLVNMNALLSDLSESVAQNPFFAQLGTTIRNLENEQNSLRRRRNDLYADYKEGLLSQKDYEYARDKYMTELDRIESRLAAIRNEQQELQSAPVPVSNAEWIERLLKFRDTTCLTKEMCKAMVEKVVIYEDTISIHFTFADEYEKVLSYMAHYTKPHGGAV